MTKPLTIIQTCGSRSWGGLEMQTLKIADALTEHGHRVSLICPPDSSILQHAEFCKVQLLPILKGDKHYFGDLKRTFHAIKSLDPDVIHTHLSHDMWTVVPAMNLAGSKARYLLTKRMGSGVNKKDPLHRLIYNRLDLVITISDIIHRDVLDTCPVPPDKVHTLINGVDLVHFDPEKANRAASRKSVGVGPDEILIGMVGRLTPGKGQREFLRATRIVLDQSDIPCRFLMIGDVSFGEERYEQEVHDLIRELKLGDRLIEMGFLKGIVELYAAMDILAFPSYDESLGNVLLEAMAMQLPIVGSNSGSVPELITDGENGLLIPPRTHEPLAEKMLMLIRDKEMRERMGQTGRKRVVANYSFEKYISKLEEFYSLSY
ncbi:glycosyltransferase family 4 protein [candidate division KSB1 bacterium]|nr:glycosyltransferase family 4 protein [candidate division KSB1 bacterium]